MGVHSNMTKRKKLAILGVGSMHYQSISLSSMLFNMNIRSQGTPIATPSMNIEHRDRHLKKVRVISDTIHGTSC
jgi:hypothetical protein